MQKYDFKTYRGKGKRNCERPVYAARSFPGYSMFGAGSIKFVFFITFKKETGKTFISWLTDYRMDHAADLMLETNEKSYKIAERVGYQDANYFSYVFKKRFGMSPSKYRTEH